MDLISVALRGSEFCVYEFLEKEVHDGFRDVFLYFLSFCNSSHPGDFPPICGIDHQ